MGAYLEENFSNYFEAVFVNKNDRNLLEKCLEIRHQVYCKENAFEESDKYHPKRESDDFDEYSAHALLVHRPSESIVGTVRLILPRAGQPDALFPMEEHCGIHLGGKTLSNGSPLPRASMAEISRFAISKEFKKRIMDNLNPWGSPEMGNDKDTQEKAMNDLQRRMIPHITLGLLAAVVHMSAAHGITHWCAVMEPALLRLLRRFSVRFDPIGPFIDYRGKRQPCAASVDDVLTTGFHECHDAWKVVTQNGAVWPAPAMPQRPHMVDGSLPLLR